MRFFAIDAIPHGNIPYDGKLREFECCGYTGYLSEMPQVRICGIFDFDGEKSETVAVEYIPHDGVFHAPSGRFYDYRIFAPMPENDADIEWIRDMHAACMKSWHGAEWRQSVMHVTKSFVPPHRVRGPVIVCREPA